MTSWCAVEEDEMQSKKSMKKDSKIKDRLANSGSGKAPDFAAKGIQKNFESEKKKRKL